METEEKTLRTPTIKVVTTNGTLEGKVEMLYSRNVYLGFYTWYIENYSDKEFFIMVTTEGNDVVIKTSSIVYIEEIEPGEGKDVNW